MTSEEVKQERKQAAFTRNCLRSLAARIDSVARTGSDIIFLRATRTEAAVLRMLIEDALRK